MPFGTLPLVAQNALFLRAVVYALVLAVKAEPLRGALSRSLDRCGRAKNVNCALGQAGPFREFCTLTTLTSAAELTSSPAESRYCPDQSGPCKSLRR